MINIRNAAPRAILKGFKDESGRAPVVEPEQLPSHLAHSFIFAERGPLLPQLVVGDSLTTTYGAKSFDYRSKYANHQTVLVNTINGEANSQIVQRLVPADAKTATLVLWLDVVADEIPQFERNADETFKLSQLGERIAVALGSPVVNGYRVRWAVEALPDDKELGELDQKVGSLTSIKTGQQSQMYPIHAFTVASPGEYGNLVGIRLSAPTTESSSPVDDTTAEESKAYLYRMSLVERPDAFSTPNVKETIQGEQSVDFAYKEGVINSRTDKLVSVDDILLQSWNAPAVNGIPATVGVINAQHVYHENIATLLEMFQAAEALKANLISDAEEDMHLFNFVGGTSINNVPYYTYVVEGPASGGVLLTETSSHYAKGGADGTLDFASFDALVANAVSNYGDLPGFDFLDTAVYPQSCIYDTGFTLPTKKKLLTVLGKRKDMYVVLSTQDVSAKQNTPSEESSIAVALRTAARMFPESEIYGTSVCRAIVIGHSGYLINSQWTKLTPLTIEFAAKSARYMGAGNGVWKSAQSFSISPANQVTMFRDVNASFKKVDVRSQDWENGLVWVQNYDRRSLFFPAFQTVYDDDSSILNSFFNMAVGVELEKIADRAWRDLVGIDSLTPDQFIARSNRLISQAAAGRFDGRVVIEVETVLTAADTQRGYSWSCNIIMYGNNMMTVGAFTIVARRREDLAQ
jgi:hypothetical protein